MEEFEKTLHEFEAKLTEKELKVLHLHYFKMLSQAKVGAELGVSQQCVQQYIKKINKKWETNFCRK